ncbi:MAG: hypothetical protein U0269_31795 [Polyangiales bacterium]
MDLSEWRKEVIARSVERTPIDRARITALEAMVERCETGFEAWEVFASRGVIPVRWIDEPERRAFAVRVEVLKRFRRARAESQAPERVEVHSGLRCSATSAPADKRLAVALAAHGSVIEEAERLALLAVRECDAFLQRESRTSSDARVLWGRSDPRPDSHRVQQCARAMQPSLARVWSAKSLDGVSLEAGPTLIAQLRVLGWNWGAGPMKLAPFAAQRERWAAVLRGLATAKRADGALEVTANLTGLDGAQTVRIERWEQRNPFEPLAALEALGVRLVAEGERWIYLAVPG